MLPRKSFEFCTLSNRRKRTNLLKPGTFTPSMEGVLKALPTAKTVELPSRRVLMREKYSCEHEITSKMHET